MENYYKGKRIAENLSKQENSPEVHDWMENNPYSKEVLNHITDEDTLEKLYEEFTTEVPYSDAKSLIDKINRIKNRRLRIIRLSIATTAALITLSFLLFSPKEKITDTKSSKIITFNKVDFNSPTLVLDNGENINLTSENEAIYISENQTIKNKQNILEYDNVTSDKVHYNRIVVPKMYTYNVKLSDGTTIFLNANSELKYPVQFQGEIREVFLRGEAFFNVSKDSKPFVVKGETGSVKVYGTRFNLNMRSPQTINTVLVEGSVGVSVKGKENKEVMLSPNQMAIVDVTDGRSVITNVDTERYTAWTTGFFRCDSEHLTTLLENISNWFDVNFEYDDNRIMDIVVSASINMHKPLDEILKLVEMISDVKFIKKETNVYRLEAK